VVFFWAHLFFIFLANFAPRDFCDSLGDLVLLRLSAFL
jgi:hypothetical protein